MRRLMQKNARNEYPDDIFKDSRMSFGDHIEELRYRMIKAIKYLILFLTIGFALDGIGYLLHNDNNGIGKPMLRIIADPVETQVRDFYSRRIEKLAEQKLSNLPINPAEEIEAIRQKWKEHEFNLTALTADERQKLLGATEVMPVIIPTDAFIPA